VKSIFVLIMFFCCGSSLANVTCKTGFEEEKYLLSDFRAISIFQKMIYLPSNFVPKYQLIKNNELKVSYLGFSLDKKGFILAEQELINGAFIERQETATSNFNELVGNLNESLKIKCGDISIRSYYESESLTEYTLIYTDILALTYVSSIKGEWKKVLKNYLK